MTDTLNPATFVSHRFRPNEIPDLSARVAIVTGGSTGIGYFHALALARANAKVIILSAHEVNGQNARTDLNRDIAENSPNGSVKWYQVDMGSLKDVDRVAKKLAQELDKVDIIICNAGIGQAPFEVTQDGIERHFEVGFNRIHSCSLLMRHFQVNNLSHYVLVRRLLPLLEKATETAPPTSVRVVMQSSEMHRVSPSSVQFASREEINKETDGALLYAVVLLRHIFSD